MRRIENIIEECRRISINQEHTDTTGIQDEDFIWFANEAVHDVITDLAATHSDSFLKEAYIDVVYGQDAYDLPKDVFLENKILNVWYSRNGTRDARRRLAPGSLSERIFVMGTPLYFIRHSGKILLSPIPNVAISNGLLVLYVKSPQKVDKRRAKVASVTLDTTAKTITALTLDTSVELDATNLLKEEYISIVDRFGKAKMQYVPLTDIDATTGVCTIDTFTYETGESIAAGDYVVRGPYSANAIEMPEETEDYIVAHIVKKIHYKDSNKDMAAADAELKEAREDLIKTFAQADDTLKGITITDTQFMDEWDLFR